MNATKLLLLFALSIVAGGCATSKIRVEHGPLNATFRVEGGVVIIRGFSDERGVTDKSVIGDYLGSPIHPAEGTAIEATVAEFAREALELAGYPVFLAGPGVEIPPNFKKQPVLEGQVLQFWLSTRQSRSVCQMEVALSLRAPEDGAVLYRKSIQAREDDDLSGTAAVRATVDLWLKSALAEFSSRDFWVLTSGKDSNRAAANCGFVTVTADQEGSEVFVNNAFMGTPPAKVSLTAGTHVIEVRKLGYRSFRKSITLLAGSELSLRASLQKE